MSNKKILIVDDDPTLLSLQERRIAALGFEIVMADSGAEAVEKLKKEEFPIVLTDIVMPNMDGMELLKHIRQHYPRTDVIMMTGFRDHYSYIDVIKAGAIDFIEKPFSAEELKAKLYRVLREQDLKRQLSEFTGQDTGRNSE